MEARLKDEGNWVKGLPPIGGNVMLENNEHILKELSQSGTKKSVPKLEKLFCDHLGFSITS